MNVFADAARPIPAFIPREAVIENLRLYRSKPEQIASMLEALSDAMQSEHYRQHGTVSDALHGEGEQVADCASSLRAALRDDAGPHPARCGCDACAVARGDALRDRERDEALLQAA
jgi:hypothetical protein